LKKIVMILVLGIIYFGMTKRVEAGWEVQVFDESTQGPMAGALFISMVNRSQRPRLTV